MLGQAPQERVRLRCNLAMIVLQCINIRISINLPFSFLLAFLILIILGRERRMSGAYSKPMPWAGGGATKPPMANNYLDSHGLNPGMIFSKTK